MAELTQRAKEIEQMHWREIQAIAQGFGFETIDDLTAHAFPGQADLKWKDFAQVLADMEVNPPVPAVEVQPIKVEATVESTPVFATHFLKTIGVTLGNDGDQRRIDFNGKPINF